MQVSRRSLVGVGLGAGIVSAASATTPPTGLSSQGGGPREARALKALAAYVEAHRAHWGLPGLTLCVTTGSGYVGLIAAGYADLKTRTPFTSDRVVEIGSISKSFTALATLRAQAQGRLSPKDDIRDLVPGVRILSEDKITLAHLLRHTSGLAHDPPLFPRNPASALWTGFAPGARWSYSNTGYELASRALERAYGESLAAILAREVLAPLGMTGSFPAIRQEQRSAYAVGYAPAEPGLPFVRGAPLAEALWTDFRSGAGCMAMSAPLMAPYLRFLIKAGRGQGAPLLSDADAAAFTGDAVDAPGWAPGARYAFGLARVPSYGRTLLHHTGGMIGFSSSMHADPEGDVACFASANVGETGYRPREITRYATELFRTLLADLPPPAPPPVAPALGDVSDLAGDYADPTGGVITIRAGDGRLDIGDRSGSASLEPQGMGAYLTLHPRFRRYPLVFAAGEGPKPQFSWGDARFLRIGVEAAPSPAAPKGLEAFAGRYDGDSGETLRLTLRDGRLHLDGYLPLERLPDGAFRAGVEPFSPERIWAGDAVDGRMERINYSGQDFYRTWDS